MDLQDYLPFWNRLSPEQQQRLAEASTSRILPAGSATHNGAEDCAGLMVVTKGQLRVYTLSEDGREITLYRLLERDMCLFSASCMMRGIQFDVMIRAEQDTHVIQIAAKTYRELMEESAPVANYTNEVMASRFSDVMWLLDQVLHKRMDSRLAALLLEEASLSGGQQLHLTHDAAARHLGSAREVVTRMLRYFQQEGLVTLSRGGIELRDLRRLTQLASGSIR